MPDKRKHRGPHPQDLLLFADFCRPTLREAIVDYSHLLTRGYATDSALKLVGDRYGLKARQRLAVMRSACSDQSLTSRRSRELPAAQCHDRPLGIDGYNLLITIESALAGGLILVGRDGCHRDLASVHGTYRKVEETRKAMELILDHLHVIRASHVDWYLDRPVSNSGRLRSLIENLLSASITPNPRQALWNIQLADSPDKILSTYNGVIATSDSAILDREVRWIALSRDIIESSIPNAWRIDLR